MRLFSLRKFSAHGEMNRSRCTKMPGLGEISGVRNLGAEMGW